MEKENISLHSPPLLLPLIKWGQTKKEVFLTVLISNAKDITYKTKLNPNLNNGNANNDDKKEETNNNGNMIDQFQFRCDQEENDKKEKRIYGFEIELEHPVKKEDISQKTFGYGVQFGFQKCSTECIPYWNWLTKNGSKQTKHFIGIDWDKWEQQEDNDSDTNDENDGNYLSHFNKNMDLDDNDNNEEDEIDENDDKEEKKKDEKIFDNDIKQENTNDTRKRR